ncbi:MAG: PP2C family protein-serine/threonine phosphatase [Dermatophilaceae bacterium]
MSLAFHYAARSDVGMVRSNNEDSGYAGPHLLAMADGMGGHAGGDVASSTVIAALVELDGESFGGRDASQALLDRITAANTEIGQQIDAEAQLEGMGTTLIALLRAADTMVLAHIGDSRAFLVRDGEVTQITRDHSFVQNLVDEGRITADEASTHPQRSLVTRVLTGAADDEPDLVVRQGRAGDRYLICSDGLTDYVARDTVAEVLTDITDPGECADRLVALALRAGAPDNVTVVVGDLVDLATTTAPPTQPQIVGAASVRGDGTRPMPVTPAAKAAALSRAATGADSTDPADDARVALAEEGPRSRRGTVLRLLAAAIVAGVIVAGGTYASYAWSQTQYYLGTDSGVVTVFRGVDQQLGPVTLSAPEYATAIDVDDLPASYSATLDEGIDVGSRTEADERVTELQVQADACRWARSNGEECRAVPESWTPPTGTPTVTPITPSGPAVTDSPTASPTPSSTATPTRAPRPSPSPGPARTPTPTVPPSP